MANQKSKRNNQCPPIESLLEKTSSYQLILSDVWGVIHNGKDVFASAINVLKNIREHNKKVYLFSNAPRPSFSVKHQLNELGVPLEAYDDIITSGDVTRSYIHNHFKNAVCFHVGPERDMPFFEGLDIQLTSQPSKANCVICTGLYDDTCETPHDYRVQLESFKEYDLPFICANPDKYVERAGTLIYCAGALSDAYNKLKGKTINLGKPHAPIYQAAMEKAGLEENEKHKILALGDSVRTDLKGAYDFSIDCLFVTGGIHKQDVAIENNQALMPSQEKIEALLLKEKLPAIGWQEGLK